MIHALQLFNCPIEAYRYISYAIHWSNVFVIVSFDEKLVYRCTIVICVSACVCVCVCVYHFSCRLWINRRRICWIHIYIYIYLRVYVYVCVWCKKVQILYTGVSFWWSIPLVFLQRALPHRSFAKRVEKGKAFETKSEEDASNRPV